ncbi:type IVB secretion system protein IcmH/DotU [Vannielia litorea]|uniref:Type VI secretion system protein ImpK n=1 Tax=Vannielia litorea TaxID=1217970 RepID=A0A1N6G0Q3_9RHOB|nr:type IVB secretion system protein IcmH/DotU [Vannielia litorea]SIO01050.1 type VI secretion system protein ImpK [Vannielia litorea]
MSDEKDSGKTVIRPMPGGAFGGQKTTGPGSQKTVIGGSMPAQGGWGSPPPASPPPGQGGGFGGQDSGFGGDGGGDVWGGGGGNTGGAGGGGGGFGGPQQGPSQGFGPPPGQNQGFGGPADHASSGQWMGAKPQQEGFFPEMRREQQQVQRAPVKKISLDAALSAKTSGMSADANPIVAAAASLLVLFGRLRSQVVDMHAVPLMQHVTEEIESFEEKMLESGVDQTDALIAKYCVCGTADDIVQNLPGTDRGVWLQYSMSARFFNKRTAGVGFFQEVDKALQNPIHKYHLLELMLICMQLGFEGQYRAMQGGDIKLTQIKRGVYEALRRVKARGDDDISPRWKGVELAARRSFTKVPVWAYAILASAILAGGYFGMRLMLTTEGNELTENMRELHPREMIELVRRTTGPVAPPPLPPAPVETGQFDRLSEAFAGNEAITVEIKGDFIIIKLDNSILFDSGKADVKEAFIPLGEDIAQVLENEPGPIRFIGHTDSDKMSGRGKYKNNFELSVARAKSVAGVITPLLSDPERVEVDGRGEDEPIASNDTPEGKALNRRVEIMIQREETLDQQI